MERNRNYWIGFAVLLIVVGYIYLQNQVETIYGGDAGDLVSAIVSRGIPHPPGYPLYTILGILMAKIIPLGTIAWRVGFLSSIPAIITFLIIYDLLFYFTNKILISLITVAILAFLYPIWLYGVTVEVFALNNLFMALLLWSFIHWFKEGKKAFLYLSFFFLGLSFTHHHTIIFLLPAFFCIFFWKRKLLFSEGIPTAVILFLLGLLPYLYIVAAAMGNPAINWQGPPTFINIVNLILRTGYGTFVAGKFIAHQPYLRLLDIWAFFDFVYKDFRPAGVIFITAGFIYLFRYEKWLWWVLFWAAVSYLFFLFYASFPLVENFTVATFERFIQPLYLLFGFYLAFGLIALTVLIRKLLLKYFESYKQNILGVLVQCTYVILPFGIAILNYPKISILRHDFTAEKYGEDILNSVPDSSILLISQDTPLFDTQYVYYTEKKWPKVKLIHMSKLFTPYYKDQLKKYYPDLVSPDNKDNTDTFRQFLSLNYGRLPIFSKVAFADSGGEWIPWGQLYRYYQKKDIPKDDYILSENEKLWNLYNDPLSGSLSKYKNLMLSDVLRYYSASHQEWGYWLGRHNYHLQAVSHLLSAEKLYPEDLDSYLILSQVYILDKNCQKADEQLNYLLSKNPQDADGYFLKSVNFAACFKDSQKASYYERLYEEKKRDKETQLKKL